MGLLKGKTALITGGASNFHVGIRHGPAKIIIRLHVHGHGFAEPKGFFMPVLLRHRDRHLEFRQFVFFQPEQRRAADFVMAFAFLNLERARQGADESGARPHGDFLCLQLGFQFQIRAAFRVAFAGFE